MAESASEIANSAQSVAGGLGDAVATAKATADAAMPIAGGTFTGDAFAISEDRSGACLRNIRISQSGSNKSTNYIAMIRK